MIKFDFAVPRKYVHIDPKVPEARNFRTYLGYWKSLAEHIQLDYDQECHEILEDLKGRHAYQKLSHQQGLCTMHELRALLFNGWISEARLHLINLDDEARLRMANHGAPVDAYYATSRLASAWLLVHTGSVPDTHGGLLKAVANEVSLGTLYPSPWNLLCTSLSPQASYSGFATEPQKISTLALDANRHDRTGTLLRTTRDRQIEKKIQSKQIQRLKVNGRLPNSIKAKCDQGTGPTTIFDFAWRMRTRSNYDDPAMFHSGTPNHDHAQLFAAAIRSWTEATMFLFEALIAQVDRLALREVADSFAKSDRSGLAETLLLPRLQVLGVA